MSDYKRLPGDSVGVIRLSDMAHLFPGETAGWREYMRRVLQEGYEPLPSDPEPQPSSWMSKASIIDKLTDDELEAFRQAKSTFPARLVFLWEDAPGGMVNIKDDRLINAFVEVIGESRAKEVLAT